MALNQPLEAEGSARINEQETVAIAGDMVDVGEGSGSTAGTTADTTLTIEDSELAGPMDPSTKYPPALYHTGSFRLLDLPLEVRRKIYRRIFRSLDIFHLGKIQSASSWVLYAAYGEPDDSFPVLHTAIYQVSKQVYKEAREEFFRIYELQLESLFHLDWQIRTVGEYLCDDQLRMIRRIGFSHKCVGPYVHPMDGPAILASPLVGLVQDPRLEKLQSLRLYTHYDKYDDQGYDTPSNLIQRRCRDYYNTGYDRGCESPIEPKGRSDMKLVLMRMRRNTLRLASQVAAQTGLKTLIEERAKKRFKSGGDCLVVNRPDRKSWWVVAMRLAKPGTQMAIPKHEERELNIKAELEKVNKQLEGYESSDTDSIYDGPQIQDLAVLEETLLRADEETDNEM